RELLLAARGEGGGQDPVRVQEEGRGEQILARPPQPTGAFALTAHGPRGGDDADAGTRGERPEPQVVAAVVAEFVPQHRVELRRREGDEQRYPDQHPALAGQQPQHIRVLQDGGVDLRYEPDLGRWARARGGGERGDAIPEHRLFGAGYRDAGQVLRLDPRRDEHATDHDQRHPGRGQQREAHQALEPRRL